MKGRKRTPTHLKEIRGTRRRDREPAHEPKPTGDLLEPPSWISTERQRQCWTWLIANAPNGLLKRLDRSLTAAFVVAEATLSEAVEELAKTSTLLAPGSTRNSVAHPLLKIIAQQSAILARIGPELGLSPASRSRIELAPEREADDGWSEVLG